MGAVTVTDICNQGLAGCGARSTITNILENSNEARKCLLFFDTTRDELLRAAQWNFSCVTDYLTLIKAAVGTPENPATASNTGVPWSPVNQPAVPWLYSYATPPDSVRVWEVLPQLQNAAPAGVPIFSVPTDTPPPFLLQRRGVIFREALDTNGQGNKLRCILTNQEQAIARYGQRIEDPNLWDSQFVTAMIGSLSWRLCIPLSGDKTLAKMGHDSAVEAVRNARVTDGNVGSTNVNRIPDWIAIRGYTGDWTTNVYDSYCAGWANPSFLGL